MMPLLELNGITKIYPAVTANDSIDLTVMPGEIHAVLGENGAGKSTLMKIIYGASSPDMGTIKWQGETLNIRNPAHARALGIGMVFQHFSLFETLTVVENISMAIEGTLSELRTRIQDASRRFGLDVDVDARVQSLSVGERQRVEILRCLLQEPKLIIMDEPTSVLPPQGIVDLFKTLKTLAADGLGILFISHKLEEIRELCDVATVLRGGKVTGHAIPRDETDQSLARMMIGRDLPHTERPNSGAEKVDLLSVKDLSLQSDSSFNTALENIFLNVRRGEIVGIAGISGNGQNSLASLLSGETQLPPSLAGVIKLGDQIIGHLDPAARRGLGLNFIPEERLGRGAVPVHSLTDNSLLTGHGAGLATNGFRNVVAMKHFAKTTIQAFDVRCGGSAAEAQSLSGGNLQKFIVGREISLKPDILIVSQPTWGVDVGAAAAIRQNLIDLSRAGTAILVISEELEELFEITDRLHVMFRGRLSQSVKTSDTDVQKVGLAMTGAFDQLSSSSELEAALDV